MRALGVEEELHVVDLATGRLMPRAPQVLRGLPKEGFASELQRSTVETNSEVCTGISDLHKDIVRLRGLADSVAAEHGLGVVAAGSAPYSAPQDFELTVLGRFSRMQQNYRFLVDDQLICGFQVHASVPDRDTAVRVAQRVGPDVPTLLAMSASSPYWYGRDTGYASFRTMVWQRWPTAGAFGRLSYAAEYDRLIDDLITSGVISDAKMAYFDVRPSAHLPTVELRVCDACPIVDDAVLIAGVFRALVDEASLADARADRIALAPEPLRRAAMWRAARSGLAGPLLDADGHAAQAGDVVRALIVRLRPLLEDNGDWDDVRELGEALLGRGDSATRQRDRFAERGRLIDVVRALHSETCATTAPPVEVARLTADYPDAREDEAIAASGLAYPAYRPLFQTLDDLGTDELVRRADVAAGQAAAAGFTFGVGGSRQPLPADLVPRIVAAHEWSVLATGLVQRARAFELFLRDVYGPARIMADGVLDAGAVERCPGWLAAARRLPQDVVRAPVIGFDLVRDALGGWRVLEDNARVPSGVGYAIGMRRLMRAALPELTVDASLRDPGTVLPLIGSTLRSVAGRSDAVVALLSDGADNAAWYEHRMIADEAGLLLAQPNEIEVSGDVVRVGGRRVDVVYLRIGVELTELTTTAGEPLGAQLFDAACHGGVVLANAPGAGVADDKSMYCLVPELIGYYLGERPLLSPVPTYRCGDPAEITGVLDRIEELVTKPVDGYGGGGVLIGPHASRAELDARRAEIKTEPSRWIAQEVVPLSTHPTLVDGRLEPRHVDLRAFVYLSGTGAGQAQVADLALTRVAPTGSMVVNSSRGGGAKDTWILVDQDEGGTS